jgi:hypothetical protein
MKQECVLNYGLSVAELENVFTQIKDGDKGAETKLYEAYLPLVKACELKYDIPTSQMYKIYDDVFEILHNAVLKGVVPAINFTMCVENTLRTYCYKFEEERVKQFNSKLLLNSYVQNSHDNSQNLCSNAHKKLEADQSLIFVTQVLAELKNNNELAKSSGLNNNIGLMIKDFYGLNPEHCRFSIMQLSRKYNVTESQVQLALVMGLKKLKEVREFASCNAQMSR